MWEMNCEPMRPIVVLLLMLGSGGFKAAKCGFGLACDAGLRTPGFSSAVHDFRCRNDMECIKNVLIET